MPSCVTDWCSPPPACLHAHARRYLGEIAPAHLRGTLGSAFLLTAVTGMLFGQIAGLPSTLGTSTGWPYILAGAALPAILQLVAFTPLLVESPRWLLLHSHPAHAADALARLRGVSTNDPDLIDELEAMGDGLGLHDRWLAELEDPRMLPPIGGGGLGGGGLDGGSSSSLGSLGGSLGGGGGVGGGGGYATLFDKTFDAALREPMLAGTPAGGGGGDGLTPAGTPRVSPSLAQLGKSVPGQGSSAKLSDGGDSAPWGALQQTIVTQPAMRKPLAICVVLMAAQQVDPHPPTHPPATQTQPLLVWPRLKQPLLVTPSFACAALTDPRSSSRLLPCACACVCA